MARPVHRLRRLLAELRRRNVYRVAVAYLVAAFVVVQLAALAGDAFRLPPWFEPTVWVFLGLGLPIALVIAWAFEVTPDGIRRTGPLLQGAEGDSSPGPVASAAAGVLVVAAVAAGGWWTLGPGSTEEASAAEGRSVAVLPFDDLSAGEREAGIGVGLTETIIAQLSLVEELSVVSRTSVMPYRETDLALPEIARRLDVEHVLEGSVQRWGDSVRIVAQLIRAETDRHLWAETFDRPFADIFEIQSEVANRIAGALEAELAASTRERIEEKPTEDPAAYDLYLRGVQLSDGSRADNRAAVELLRQAIRMDSTFALAHAGLANAYMHRAQDFGYPYAWFDSARATARRAVELDPELAQGHKEVATAAGHLGRLTEAMSSFRRAIALRPGYGEAIHNLGIMYARQGEYSDALPWYWRSLPIGPRDPYPRRSIGVALHLLEEDSAGSEWIERTVELGSPRWKEWPLIMDFAHGRMDAVREHLEELRQSSDGTVGALLWGGVLAQVDGRPGEAVPGYRRLYEQQPDYRGTGISPRLRLAQALQSTGRRGEARPLLEDAERWNRSLVEDGSERFPPRNRLAAAHLLQGEVEAAYRWLDSAYRAGYRIHPVARHDPIWRRVRDQARFRELLERMEADLRRQRSEARAWAREEGIDWPPLPEVAESARTADRATSP